MGDITFGFKINLSNLSKYQRSDHQLVDMPEVANREHCIWQSQKDSVKRNWTNDFGHFKVALNYFLQRHLPYPPAYSSLREIILLQTVGVCIKQISNTREILDADEVFKRSYIPYKKMYEIHGARFKRTQRTPKTGFSIDVHKLEMTKKHLLMCSTWTTYIKHLLELKKELDYGIDMSDYLMTPKQVLICNLLKDQTNILAKGYREMELTDLSRFEGITRFAYQNLEISQTPGFYRQFIRICTNIPKLILNDPVLSQILQVNCLNKQAFYLLMVERGASEDNVAAYLADQNLRLAIMLANKQPLPWLSCGTSEGGNMVVQASY